MKISNVVRYQPQDYSYLTVSDTEWHKNTDLSLHNQPKPFVWQIVLYASDNDMTVKTDYDLLTTLPSHIVLKKNGIHMHLIH